MTSVDSGLEMRETAISAFEIAADKRAVGGFGGLRRRRGKRTKGEVDSEAHGKATNIMWRVDS